MNNYSLNQACIFVIFILVGITIGIIFDFFRALRKNVRNTIKITYIQDLIFWIISGIIVIYSIYFFNSGEIRLYIFLGITTGLIIYILVLSKFFLSINDIIIKFFISLILKPIKKIIDIILQIFKKIFNFIKKYTYNLKKHLKKRRNLRYNVEK